MGFDINYIKGLKTNSTTRSFLLVKYLRGTQYLEFNDVRSECSLSCVGDFNKLIFMFKTNNFRERKM